jgi:hypothetical protein
VKPVSVHCLVLDQTGAVVLVEADIPKTCCINCNRRRSIAWTPRGGAGPSQDGFRCYSHVWVWASAVDRL